MNKLCFEPILNILKKVHLFFRKPVIKVIIILVIFIFVSAYFVTNYQEFSSAFQEIRINYIHSAFAFLLVLLTVFIGTITWWLILSWLGFRKNLLGIIKGYAVSSLAKYIPGFVWQYASRSVFLESYNIPITTIGYAIGIEFLLVTSLGGILSCISYWAYGYQLIELHLIYKILIILLLIALILFLIILPRLLTSVTENKNKLKFQLINKFYVYAVIVNFSGWLLLSWAFLLLAKAIGISNVNYQISVFLHSSNFFIANLFLPIPNGLIIREAIIIFLADSLVNQHLLILMSMLLRTFIFFAEIILTFFLFVLYWVNPD